MGSSTVVDLGDQQFQALCTLLSSLFASSLFTVSVLLLVLGFLVGMVITRHWR